MRFIPVFFFAFINIGDKANATSLYVNHPAMLKKGPAVLKPIAMVFGQGILQRTHDSLDLGLNLQSDRSFLQKLVCLLNDGDG